MEPRQVNRRQTANTSEIAADVIRYLATAPLYQAATDDIYINVPSAQGISETAFEKLLATLHRRGYVYNVGGAYWKPTASGRSTVESGNNEFTADLGEQRQQEAGTYEEGKWYDYIDEVVRPAWEKFKEDHPEYATVFRAMEDNPVLKWDRNKTDARGNNTSLYGFFQEVFTILRNKKVMPYRAETEAGSYKYTPELASSVENVIASCFFRLLQHYTTFKSKNYPAPDKLYTAMKSSSNVIEAINGLDINTVLSQDYGIGSYLSLESLKDSIAQHISMSRLNAEAKQIVSTHIENTVTDRVKKLGKFVVSNMSATEGGDVLHNLFAANKKKGVDILQRFQGTLPDADVGVSIISEALSNRADGSLDGVDFVGADFSEGITIEGSSFVGTRFDRADFTNATVRGNNFGGASFTRAKLGAKVFKQNNIDGADFARQTGLGSPGTDFGSNTGKPRNLEMEVVSVQPEEYKNVTGKFSQRHTHQSVTFAPEERKIAVGLLKLVLNAIQDKKITLSSLRFSVEDQVSQVDQSGVDYKADLERLLSSNGEDRASWLMDPASAKAKIVELNKSGELARMGLSQAMGKLMGILSGPKAPKDTRTPEQIETENVLTKLQGVIGNTSESGKIDKQQLLGVLPEFAFSLRSLIDSNITSNVVDLHHLQGVLSNALVDLNLPTKVTQDLIRPVIRPFAYTSRIDPYGNDIGRASQSSYNSAFAVVIEAQAHAGYSPLQHDFFTWLNSPKGTGSHWNNVIAASRVRPVTYTKISDAGTQSKSVWVDTENQSDLFQDYYDNYKEFIEVYSSEHPDFVKESNISQQPYAPKNSPLSYALASAYIAANGKADSPVSFAKIAAVAKKYFPNGIDEQQIRDLLSNPKDSTVKNRSGSDLQLHYNPNTLFNITSDGLSIKKNKVVDARANACFADVAHSFSDWPSMCMLDVANRAAQRPEMDEIWVLSYARTMDPNDPAGKKWLNTGGRRDVLPKPDRRPMYDDVAAALGGRFVTLQNPLPKNFDEYTGGRGGGGSDLFSFFGGASEDNPMVYDKIWSVDLTPFRVNISPNEKWQQKSGQYTAIVTDVARYAKYAKAVGSAKEPVTDPKAPARQPFETSEDLQNPEFVVVYTLNELNKDGNFKKVNNIIYVDRYRDFVEKFSRGKTASLLSLHLSEGRQILASEQADSVMKYVRDKLQKYPWARFLPMEFMLSSGIARRVTQNRIDQADIESTIQEIEAQEGVAPITPILNYVKICLNALNHVKKNTQRLVSSTGEAKSKIADEMIQSYLQKHAQSMPEPLLTALRKFLNSMSEEFILPEISESDAMGLGLPGSGGGGEAVSPSGESVVEDTSLKIPEATKDTSLSFEEPSEREVGKYKQMRVDEYLDQLQKALDEGDVQRAEQIKKNLRRISSIRSLRFS